MDQASAPWGIDQLHAEVARRGAAAARARELPVDYYRIGYRLAWPLPIGSRPRDFPAPIPGIPGYPWLVWIGWGLEERWAALSNAGHTETVLAELAGLTGWTSFVDDSDQAGLITGSLALWLTRGLEAAAGRRRDELAAVADRLITDSLLPRYRRERTVPPADDLRRLQNIRLIPLFTAGRLAALLDHPALPELREPADQAVSLWVRLRRDAGYTEGVGYDGYLVEQLLEWLAVAPDPEATEEVRRAALGWPATTVPGRPGVQVPLGDVEPEMTQWLTVIAAVAAAEPGLAAWCRTVPLPAFPSAALTRMLAWPEAGDQLPEPSITGVRQQAAVALRTGGDGPAGEVLVAVATPRVEVGHLHRDAGQVVLGWRGRTWISDPGYQQYRAGSEREFTLDHGAHNAPVIDGAGQTRRAAVLTALSPTEAVVDLAGCYPERPPGTLSRTVRLDGAAVLVRDEFAGATEVITHWLAPADLRWQFLDGWVRLSDDQGAALWFGCSSTDLSPGWLGRHPGSRGQLTLTVPTTTERTEWCFVLEPSAGWQPPSTSILER